MLMLVANGKLVLIITITKKLLMKNKVCLKLNLASGGKSPEDVKEQTESAVAFFFFLQFLQLVWLSCWSCF